jgi:cytochrome c556
VLTPEEGQKKLDEQHDTFVAFAHSLNDVGAKLLAAIDAKNPQGMMDAGAEMDEVCESCHMTFWYPNQKIPELPDNVPATIAPKKK